MGKKRRSADHELELPADRYFKCGDIVDLKAKIELLFDKGISQKEQQQTRKQLEDKYNWNKIADQTIAVYEKARRREG